MDSQYFSNAILSINTGKREANMSLKQIARQVGHHNSTSVVLLGNTDEWR